MRHFRLAARGEKEKGPRVVSAEALELTGYELQTFRTGHTGEEIPPGGQQSNPLGRYSFLSPILHTRGGCPLRKSPTRR